MPNQFNRILSSPLLALNSHFLKKQSSIESWFRMQWQKTPPPFYSSVDLRNSGFKLAPIDTNLFSAGFNNLSPDCLSLCVQAIQDAVTQVCLSACKILIIPEEHTRNLFYLESLATLQIMLEKAGFETKIGSLNIDEPTKFSLPSDKTLEFVPLILENGRLKTANFTPCICLLNNDLSSGIPDILTQAKQSLFIPPLELGWSNRLKSNHFDHYKEIANNFAQHLNLDPWLIDPMFSRCKAVDFTTDEGEHCLIENVGKLLDKIQKKYDQYGINKKPFVLVKSDTGTYGMGIIVVHSTADIAKINRKQRKKMSANKGGSKVNRVIIQEGVYTFETTDNGHVCEPVVYMIDKTVVGGFYRVHSKKGDNENLNSPGAHFEPLYFNQPLNTPNRTADPDAEKNRFYAYGVVARLAMLAAAREISETLQDS